MGFRCAALPWLMAAVIGGVLPLAAQAQTLPANPASAASPSAPMPPSSVPTPPPVAAQVFGDWIYRCQEATEPGKPAHATCEIVQQMVVRQADKTVPVMTVALTADLAGRPYTVTVLAPLGVLLKQPLTLAVDDGHPVPLDYQFCDARGCFARAALPQPLLAQIKHGKQGHARIVLSDGRGVILNFALGGAAEALAAFEAGKAPLMASGPAPSAVPVPPAPAPR